MNKPVWLISIGLVALCAIYGGGTWADITYDSLPVSPNPGQTIPGTQGIIAGPGVDLSEWYMPGHDLSFANLSLTDLTAASFADSDLANANFLSSTLTNANFAEAIISGTDFSNTTSNGFTSAQLYSTFSYRNSKLSSIQFQSDNLSGWNFANQNLAQASFNSATLTGANFMGATLTNATLANADAVGAKFEYSMRVNNGANLSGANLTNADLANTNFIDANLTNAGFINANLTAAEFDDTIVENTNFTHADLTSAILYGLALTSTNFTNANLTDSNFTNAVFSTSILTNSNLTDANLAGANLANTNLAELNLSDADLRGATGFAPAPTTNIHDSILPDGSINGLTLQPNETLIIRYNTANPGPIIVHTTAAFDPASTIQFQLYKDFTSPMKFDAGLTPSLSGTLDLEFIYGNASSLVGDTFQIFEWTGPLPANDQFSSIITRPGFQFDTSNLYTTGMVTLTSIPEPASATLLAAAAIALLTKRPHRQRPPSRQDVPLNI